MIKFLKDKWIFLVFVLVVVGILSISGNFQQSTSNAKYRSEISSTDDSARVAKWNITTISEKDGASIDLDAGFGTTLSTGSTGNWFIEIGNESEVNAILSNDTTVRFRLDHTIFDKDSDASMSWDFLKDSNGNTIENPVTISVSIYKSTIDNIEIAYQTTVEENGTATIKEIDKAAYDALSEENKKAYAEVVKNTGVLVFKTTDQTFEKAVETVNSKLVYYYYKDVKVSEIPGLTETIKQLKMNDSTTNLTIGINWSTGQDGGGGTGVSDTKKYNAYELIQADSLPSGYVSVGSKTFTIDGVQKKYYVAYRECYFFDYQIFTSGFGGNGEPYFKFPGGFAGAELIVYFSQLDETQKNTVNGYLTNMETTTLTSAISAATTVDALQHIVDYCRYKIHEDFIEDNELFQESLTYLQYGLTCSVQLTIKVEQKD